MLAISFEDNRLTFHSDYPAPEARDAEVLVRVTQAGICETDLQLIQGYMGFSGVLGHEFVGIAQSGKYKGKRVVGEINCNCQTCPRCISGLGNHCGNRSVIGIDRHDGAFAELVAVPEHCLHLVPDSVSDDQAVFVEPLAAAFQILDQFEVNASDKVLIMGDGRLAMMCTQALSQFAPVQVIGKHPEKLVRFQSLLIGHEIQTSLLHDSEFAAQSQCYDLVVDCTGSTSGLATALQKVRPRGTVVMKTTVASEHQISLADVVINEINLVGSRCGPFAKAIQAIDSGKTKLNGLITHRYRLDQAHEAFRKASSSESFKVVFDIG